MKKVKNEKKIIVQDKFHISISNSTTPYNKNDMLYKRMLP
jgi:hypothetical protein